jgi:hypothetical protein
VVLLPKLPATALRGIIKSRRKAPSLAAIDEAIAQGAAGKARNKRR